MIQQVDKSGAPYEVKQNPIYQNLDPELFSIARESDDLTVKMNELF